MCLSVGAGPVPMEHRIYQVGEELGKSSAGRVRWKEAHKKGKPPMLCLLCLLCRGSSPPGTWGVGLARRAEDMAAQSSL